MRTYCVICKFLTEIIFYQAPSNRAPKARREKQASRLVLTSRDAMLIGEGKKLQEPFLPLICLTPN